MLSYYLVRVYCMEFKADVVPTESIIVKAFLDEENFIRFVHINEV